VVHWKLLHFMVQEGDKGGLGPSGREEREGQQVEALTG
jgi:hypothetical protein